MADGIDITLTADAAALPVVEAALEAFAERHELPPRTGYTLALIVEELVTNIVKYGYAGADAGPLKFTVHIDQGRVVGTLIDAGAPFDPTAMKTPDVAAEMEARHIGGLGVHLVRTMSEDFSYRRDGGHNVVSFRLPIG
jgi:anti-sigma regulatory factor (Ser/Thr protein kinase)